jgi:hypothetical protein
VPKTALFLLLLGALPKSGDEPAPLPAPRLALRLQAPDVAGPWKMVVTNDGESPLRFAADGRLLSLEIEPPEDGGLEAPYGKPGKKKPPKVVCRLPPELRPIAVFDDRAIVLGPGNRYEEVVSPDFYCFGEAEAKALVPGARVTAKLGFPDSTKGPAKTPPRPPFLAEPATVTPAVSAIKEITAEPFVVAAAPPASMPNTSGDDKSNDPTGPRLQLFAPARVDSPDEKTVFTKLTLKNAGQREARVNIRRDNLVFDIDGPDGSSHCGLPSSRRAVPRERFDSIGAGASRTIEVWLGEMCPNNTFDRPGLYRVWAGLAFPRSTADEGSGAWTRTVVTEEPILVRIRKGRLPFFTRPPQKLGDASASMR